MAVSYGFFNSFNHDRLYDATDISKFFDGLIHDGVYSSIGEGFLVKAGASKYADPYQFKIGSGKAWFDHVWIKADDETSMETNISDVRSLSNGKRIDAITIFTDSAARTAGFEVVRGTVSSSYTYPTVTDTSTKKYHIIAYLKFMNENNRACLDQIETKVGTSLCPWVTGILSSDTSDIFEYVQQQWNTYIAEKDAEFNQFDEQIEDWEDSEETKVNNAISSYQSEFTTWFNALKATISGDPAIAISNQIQDIQNNYVNKSSISQTNVDDASKIPSAKVVYDLSQQVGPIVVTPTWADASDEEIVTALQKAYAGEVDLHDDYGWDVGDERVVPITAADYTFDSLTTDDYQTYYIRQISAHINAGYMTLVLMDTNVYDLADNSGKCKFVVGTKESFRCRYNGSRNGDCVYDVVNGTDDFIIRKFSDSDPYTILNDVFINCFPNYIQQIFKSFKAPDTIYNDSTHAGELVYTTQKLIIPAAFEIFGNQASDRGGFDLVEYYKQLEWYKTGNNRIIPPMDSDVENDDYVFTRSKSLNTPSAVIIGISPAGASGTITIFGRRRPFNAIGVI